VGKKNDPLPREIQYNGRAWSLVNPLRLDSGLEAAECTLAQVKHYPLGIIDRGRWEKRDDDKI
jgi:hypothetical protein